MAGADLEEVDWAGRDLVGANLEGAHLGGAKLSEANLQGANLSGADLRGADLHRADLRGADLSGADLREARLRGAQLTDTRLAGARIDGVDAEPQLIEALRRGGATLGGLAGLWARAAALVPRRWVNPLKRRAMAKGRAKASSVLAPGGALRGADLSGQNLSGASWAGVDLSGCNLTEVRLESADLSGAVLVETALEGAELAGARLRGIRAQRAGLVDADLRRADLTDADLSGADLSGADLRDAILRGARLNGATLRAARLSDQDLDGVSLDGASLDQADLAGVSWRGASVQGADLAGALGLGEEERTLLVGMGARLAEDGALAAFSARWVRGALTLGALGLCVYLAARFLAPGAEAPEHLAEEAEALRDADPLEASQRYEALAKAAERPEDQVSYRIEAAGLAETAGDTATAERLLKEALSAAGDDTALSGRARLKLGELLSTQKRWAELEAAAEPLLTLEGQPEVERARGFVLYEDATAARGKAPEKAEEAIAALDALPESQGALLVAIAEIRANRGQDELALKALDALEGLTLPAEASERAMASRARVLDRLGRSDEAAAAWKKLLDSTAADTLPHQSAVLALADLDRRAGAPDRALERIVPLLEDDADARLHGRALLLRGGILEDRGAADAAIKDYRAVLGLAGLDEDTVSEARLNLARLLLASGGEAGAAAVLKDLPKEAAEAVLAEARLGEGRRLLDSGETEKALKIFEQIERAGAAEGAGGVLDPGVLRAARVGHAEALANAGQTQEAIGLLQEILDEGPPPAERSNVVLLLAQALLSRGDAERARTMFTELAADADPESRAQGQLGLAAVAEAAGELERAQRLLQQVADSGVDPAWRARALREQAELAADQGKTEAALEAWRAVIGVLPPGHPAALEARLSIVSALEAAGRLDEAKRACAGAGSATAGSDRASVQLFCGELAERTRDLKGANAALSAVVADPGADEAQVSEAGVGLARIALDPAGPPDAAAATRLLDGALARCTTPAARVPLLAMKARALELAGDKAGAAAANRELDGLAASAPTAAADFYSDAASRARARGSSGEAVALLERAVALSLPPETAVDIRLDLGDALLDQGKVDEAGARFQEAAAGAAQGTTSSFLAELGLAEVQRREGDPAGAVKRLRALTPGDESSRQRWLESLATALSEAGDPEAQETWQELSEGHGEGDETRVMALRGQADAALAAGKATDALALYEQVNRTTTEVSMQGWASLGAAEALIALKRDGEATASLRALAAHPDPEVSLQAAIRLSNLASEGRRWDEALQLVEGRDGAGLGPAWDATLTEARVRALAGKGERQAAREALDALAKRWPGEEEAQLPALMGLAHLAHQEGKLDEARAQAQKALAAASDPGYKKMAQDLINTLAKK